MSIIIVLEYPAGKIERDAIQTMQLYPVTRVEIIQGTPTPTLPPGITPTPGAPGALPVTGTWPNSVVALSAGLLAVGAGLVSLVLIRRKQSS